MTLITSQKNVDNTISKAIDLPERATVESIVENNVEVFRIGLKGTAVFRDRSRSVQVLSCSSQQICDAVYKR